MATLYENLQGGTITDNPLTSGATTINSSAFQYLPTVTSPDVLYLTLDPSGANGAPEIVKVTAHTASATSVTVVRGQQDTTAREHPTASQWIHGVTEADLLVLTQGIAQPGDLKVTLRTTQDSGWLNHNQSIPNADTAHPALWAVAPASWKSGTTLNIPDLTDVVLMGAGGLAAVGAVAGANTATLTSAELPAHVHTVSAHTHTASSGEDSHSHSVSVSVASGGGHSHSATTNAKSTFIRGGFTSVQSGSGTTVNTGASYPTHDHSVTVSYDSGHTHTGSGSAASAAHSHTVTVDSGGGGDTSSTGSGNAFSIVQKSLGVNIQVKT